MGDCSRASLTFGYTALQAGVERVARKEREQLWLVFEPLIIAVIIAESLKSCKSSDRFSRGSVDVIHVVVVEEAEVWRGRGVPAGEDRNLFGSRRCTVDHVCLQNVEEVGLEDEKVKQGKDDSERNGCSRDLQESAVSCSCTCPVLYPHSLGVIDKKISYWAGFDSSQPC